MDFQVNEVVAINHNAPTEAARNKNKAKAKASAMNQIQKGW